MDFLVNQMVNRPEVLRLRQATVVSVQTGRTCTVQIAGQTATTQKVRYLSNFAPLPGYHVWVATDGTDLLAIGHVGAANKTLAPRAYRTTNYNVILNTNTYVPFEAVESDEWDMWDIASPTVLTCRVSGRYQATASVLWQGQNNSYIATWVEKGTQEIGRQDAVMATKDHGFHMSVTTVPFTMAVGDTVRMGVHHDYNPSNNLILSSGGVDHTGYFNALSVIYLGS
jgi:hypothetical protein